MDFANSALLPDALMLKANRLQSEYQKKRERFYNRVKAFYNSSIASNYVTEDSLVSMLCELEDIKHEYNKVCEALKGQGRRTTFGGGGVRNGNDEPCCFSLDVLHVC